MSYGAQIKFGIAHQVAVGSGNAVTNPGSFHHVALISEDVGLEKDEVISQNLTGRFEQGATYAGVSRVNGTIEFEATPKAMGAFLSFIVGSAQVVATSGSMKTFTFFPRTADYSATIVSEPITIYKQFADAASADCFFDCQFDQLALTFTQGQLLKARATVAGGSRIATGVGSLGLTLDGTDLGLGFLWDSTSVSWGGAGLGQQSEVTITLNENIDPIYTLNGTLSPYKYTRRGFREVTVNGTLYFDSRSVFNDFVSNQQRQLIVVAEARKTQIQSGYYARILVDVPQLKLLTMKPGARGPGEVSASFTGRGIIDPASNYTIQFQLTNTYASNY